MNPLKWLEKFSDLITFSFDFLTEKSKKIYYKIIDFLNDLDVMYNIKKAIGDIIWVIIYTIKNIDKFIGALISLLSKIPKVIDEMMDHLKGFR